MNRFLLALLSATFIFAGCGSSENYVFTNSPNNNVPGGPMAGVAAQLAFVANPAQTTNTDFTVAPVVEVQDAFGTRVPGATNSITVSLVNPGTALLSGQTTRNAVDGRAVFPGLSVDQPGSFTLQATSPGLESASSARFVVKRVALYASYRDPSINGDASPSTLIELNPDNGATIGALGQIGNGNVFGSVQGIECLPDGRILGVAEDLNDQARHLLLDIDPADPRNGTTVIGEINNDAVGRVHELTYDSENQILYASASRVNGPRNVDFFLMTINTTTGAGTMFANPSFNDVSQHGSTICYDDTTDTLFYSRIEGSDGDELYSLNVVTGAPTFIGLSPRPRGSIVIGVSGMDIHPVTGVMVYATRNNPQPDHFGVVNKTNGLQTVTGSAVNVSSISFCEDAPVGPATGSL